MHAFLKSSTVLLWVNTAASGKPNPRALPRAMMSGAIPKCSIENILPVVPMLSNTFKTEKDRLIARIIGNNLRRTVSSNEKTELLDRLGEIYFSQAIEPRRIAYKISEETGMSYQWVMKYLPSRFKDHLQSEKAKPALRRRAETSKLLDPPGDMLSIRAYANTEFVNIVVKKPLYEQLKEKAKKLQTTLDKLMYNAILLILKT